MNISTYLRMVVVATMSIYTVSVQAQSVGISSTAITPDPAALLE